MSDASDSLSEEERSLFRPFTRESLAAIEARIAEEHAKQKELEKKRAEGEVRLFMRYYERDPWIYLINVLPIPRLWYFSLQNLACYVYTIVGIQINCCFRSAWFLIYFVVNWCQNFQSDIHFIILHTKGYTQLAVSVKKKKKKLK